MQNIQQSSVIARQHERTTFPSQYLHGNDRTGFRIRKRVMVLGKIIAAVFGHCRETVIG
jgi:hypothetical protein